MSERNGELQFKEVSLTQLVDSPAIIGANFRKFPLTSTGIMHEVDAMADTTAALEMKPETLTGLKAGRGSLRVVRRAPLSKLQVSRDPERSRRERRTRTSRIERRWSW